MSIVTELPTTSTDRLMAVADIIEFRPHLYRQGEWWTEHHPFPNNTYEPWGVYGKAVVEPEPTCRTTACIAGWAVALTPRPRHLTHWSEAGAQALGLSPQVAGYLFSATFHASAPVVADMLRRIARLPEGERTFSNMPLVLNDDQLRALMHIGASVVDDDDEDEEDYDEVEDDPIVPTPDEGAPEPLDAEPVVPVLISA